MRRASFSPNFHLILEKLSFGPKPNIFSRLLCNLFRPGHPPFKLMPLIFGWSLPSHAAGCNSGPFFFLFFRIYSPPLVDQPCFSLVRPPIPIDFFSPFGDWSGPRNCGPRLLIPFFFGKILRSPPTMGPEFRSVMVLVLPDSICLAGWRAVFFLTQSDSFPVIPAFCLPILLTRTLFSSNIYFFSSLQRASRGSLSPFQLPFFAFPPEHFVVL